MGTEAILQCMKTVKLEVYLLCKRVRRKIRKGEKEDLPRAQRDKENWMEEKAVGQPSVITERDLAD